MDFIKKNKIMYIGFSSDRTNLQFDNSNLPPTLKSEIGHIDDIVETKNVFFLFRKGLMVAILIKILPCNIKIEKQHLIWDSFVSGVSCSKIVMNIDNYSKFYDKSYHSSLCLNIDDLSLFRGGAEITKDEEIKLEKLRKSVLAKSPNSMYNEITVGKVGSSFLHLLDHAASNPKIWSLINGLLNPKPIQTQLTIVRPIENSGLIGTNFEKAHSICKENQQHDQNAWKLKNEQHEARTRIFRKLTQYINPFGSFFGKTKFFPVRQNRVLNKKYSILSISTKTKSAVRQEQSKSSPTQLRLSLVNRSQLHRTRANNDIFNVQSSQIIINPDTLQRTTFLDSNGNVNVLKAYREVLIRKNIIGNVNFQCSFSRFKKLAIGYDSINATEGSVAEAITALQGELHGL